MDEKSRLPDDILTLRYGLVVVTFGQEAVDKVLKHDIWRERYPEVIRGINSDDLSIKSYTILPIEIIHEIAGQDECIDDYYADSDGERLYAADRTRNWKEPSAAEVQGHKRIPNQEAYLTFGPYCLFMASDRGIGYKGERGLPQDHGYPAQPARQSEMHS